MKSSSPNTKNSFTHNDWSKYFRKHGIKDELVDLYLPFIKTCYKNSIPVIFESKHLSLLLGRSHQFVVTVTNKNELFYRTFDLPKRSGGKREISVPMPSLLESQLWIKDNILDHQLVHTSAHGFVNDRSTITNASVHVSNDTVLKMDLKDFFPSIKINRIIKYFNDLGYSKKVALTLSKFCTLNDALPQGAPTSPLLSNIVNITLDKRLYALAEKFNFSYSRYADDITFSAQKIPTKFIEYVTNIVKDQGYEINGEKTSLSIKGSKQIITGISVSNNEMKLPRSYKRSLRQELYYIEKYGFFGHAKSEGIKDPYYVDKLLGKVGYWLSIEVDNSEALKYKDLLVGIKKNL